MDPLEPDPISLSTLVEHWSKLQSLGSTSGVDIQLPIVQLIDDGYGAPLERTPTLRGAIDQALLPMSQDWRHCAKREADSGAARAVLRRCTFEEERLYRRAALK
jgi:hypothetical protein